MGVTDPGGLAAAAAMAAAPSDLPTGDNSVRRVLLGPAAGSRGAGPRATCIAARISSSAQQQLGTIYY
jgi:hypothetical protein